MMDWKKPENAERLKALWGEGHSCSVIARMFGNGVTRNAIIGAVTRAGLQPRAQRQVGGSSMKRALRRKIKAAKKQSNSLPYQPRSSLDLILTKAPIPPPAETDVPAVSILDIEADQCRWPCWDKAAPPSSEPAFCGKAVAFGLPYCEQHARRAFAPPQPRPRRREANTSNVIRMPIREKVAA